MQATLCLVRDYLRQIILKTHHAGKLIGRTPSCFTETYAQNLNANCDRDLYDTYNSLSSKLFMPNSSTMQGKVMGQTQTCFTRDYAVKVQTWTLTFDLATWFLYATYCLLCKSFVPNNSQIQPCKAKIWAGHKQFSQTVCTKCKYGL